MALRVSLTTVSTLSTLYFAASTFLNFAAEGLQQPEAVTANPRKSLLILIYPPLSLFSQLPKPLFGSNFAGANTMNLYLGLEEYLAQWFINDQGGNNPVRLIRGSVEWCLLEQFLQTPPSDYVPQVGGEGFVCILLPNFRSKDTRCNFYLPPKATEALKACIRNRFDIDMWNALHRFDALFQRQDHLIYAFMEKRHIELTEKNWNAVAKRYQRKRDIYRRIERRKKNLQK